MQMLQKLAIYATLILLVGMRNLPTYSQHDTSVAMLGHGVISSLDRHPQDASLLVAGNRGLWHYGENFQLLSHYSQVKNIRLAKWNNSGDLIAVRQENGFVYLFQIEQQHYIQIFEDPDPEAKNLPMAWSPNDKFLAVVAGDESQDIIVLDVETQLPLSQIQQDETIGEVAWRDDATLLYKPLFGPFQTWNIETNDIEQLDITPSQIYSISPQSSLVAIYDFNQRQLEVWNPATNLRETTIKTSNAVSSIDWNTQNNKFAFVTRENEILVWDISMKALANSIDASEFPPIGTIIWNSDSDVLFTVDWAAGIQAWNLDENRLEHHLQKHSLPIDFIAWQPNGKLIAVNQGYEQFNWIKLWNVDTGKVEQMIRVPNVNVISNLMWNELGNELLASFHNDRGDFTPEVYVWAMEEDGLSLNYTYHSDTRFVTAVPGTTVTPVLNYEAIGDNKVVLWDAVEDTERLIIDDTDNEYILLSHHNKLAILDEAQISIWDMETLELVSRSDLPEDLTASGLSQVAWNESEGLFAGGICYQFGPCPVWVWDYETSEVTFSLEEYDRGTTKFSFLNDIEWSPDNTMLVTAGGEDTKVMVWTPEGELVTEFTDFSDFVMSVSWSSDSSMLAVATVNGDVQILQVQ